MTFQSKNNFQENEFEKFACKLAAIFVFVSRPQCDKSMAGYGRLVNGSYIAPNIKGLAVTFFDIESTLCITSLNCIVFV